MTKALERFDILYDRFDKVVISFSGGKDSTTCLNLALKVATERKRLPLDVYFWDEEAIHPETIEYVRRVAERDDVRFKWLCVPIKHRNACSIHQPWWFPWAEEDKHKWVRDLPSNLPKNCTLHRTIPGFKRGMNVPELAHAVYGPEHGMIADVRGLRAEESIRRYRAVSYREVDNWIGSPRAGYSVPVSPIYDWSKEDVWFAALSEGWDYNKTYDIMSLMGLSPHDQRVCPPYGEEPSRNLWIYSVGWPDLWAKMTQRVQGAATAARYSQTELYAFRDTTKPEGLTYQEHCLNVVARHPPKERAFIAKALKASIAEHYELTSRPIHDFVADPRSGYSWKMFANVAIRGDLKGRRLGNRIVQLERILGNMKLDFEQSINISEDEMTALFEKYLADNNLPPLYS